MIFSLLSYCFVVEGGNDDFQAHYVGAKTRSSQQPVFNDEVCCRISKGLDVRLIYVQIQALAFN